MISKHFYPKKKQKEKSKYTIFITPNNSCHSITIPLNSSKITYPFFHQILTLGKY